MQISIYDNDEDYKNWITTLSDPVLSKNSKIVLTERYFKRDSAEKVIETPKQFFARIAWHLAQPEVDRFSFATKIYNIMIEGKAMFNTPTLFNAGLGNGLGLSACYILEPEDSLESIMDVCKNLALIQKCIPKDQLIYSDRGKIEAGSLKAGDKIWTPEGMKAIKKVHNPGSKPCYEVTVDGRTCQMAGTHKILSKDKSRLNSSTKYRPLDKLSEGSMVSLYSKKPDTCSNRLPTGFIYDEVDNSGKKLMYNDVSIPTTLSQDLAYLLGLWQGDGSKDNLRIRFHNTDSVLCSEFTNCVKSIFNTDKFGTYVQERTGKDAIEICFNSKKMSSFFDFIGMRKDKSYLPEWLLNSADEYKWAFLQGLLDTDGCVRSQDVIAVSTKHKNIALSVQSILDSLGVGSTINCQYKDGKEYYDLRVLLCDTYKYSEGMPFKTTKVEKLNSIPKPTQNTAPNNSRWSPIQTIEFIGDKDCVDFTLEDNSLHIYMVGDLITHNSGGGVGYNFSKLRPKGSIVASCNATTDGPLPFIDMYCSTTSAIQQGAKRRGAQMGMLAIDHPDIWDFIHAKANLDRWQNMNVSPKVTDKWMRDAVYGEHRYHRVEHPKWGVGFLRKVNGKAEVNKSVDGTTLPPDPYTPSDLFDEICRLAWENGEPGLFFEDRVNRDWVFKNSRLYPIVATNPCGEIPGENGMTCNLASINLAKCQSETELEYVVRVMIRALDNVVEMNEFPVPLIEEINKATRRIGLGVMGWADFLFDNEIPYSSDTARGIAKKLMEKIARWSCDESTILGIEKGNFGAFEKSDYFYGGVTHMRNAYRNMHAPTGTISIIADCSCGIEPIYSLAFEREVLEDANGKRKKMTEFNPYFKAAVEKHTRMRCPISSEQSANDEIVRRRLERIAKYAAENGSIQNYEDEWTDNPDWQKIKQVFITAKDVSVEDHIRMQAAWQESTDQAISKTINLPNEATVEDVKRAYKLAWELGCKGITVYRDGCRDGKSGQVQPMKLTKAEPKEEKSIEETDDIASSTRVRQPTPLGKLHVNIVHDSQGNPKELFAQLSKSGELATADLEAICRLSSLWLRSGGSFDVLIKQLEHLGSSIMLPTKNGKIKSLPDGLAVALKRFKKFMKTGENNFKEQEQQQQYVKPTCPDCGSLLKMEEGCQACSNPTCGYSKC